MNSKIYTIKKIKNNNGHVTVVSSSIKQDKYSILSFHTGDKTAGKMLANYIDDLYRHEYVSINDIRNCDKQFESALKVFNTLLEQGNEYFK